MKQQPQHIVLAWSEVLPTLGREWQFSRLRHAAWHVPGLNIGGEQFDWIALERGHTRAGLDAPSEHWRHRLHGLNETGVHRLEDDCTSVPQADPAETAISSARAASAAADTDADIVIAEAANQQCDLGLLSRYIDAKSLNAAAQAKHPHHAAMNLHIVTVSLNTRDRNIRFINHGAQEALHDRIEVIMCGNRQTLVGDRMSNRVHCLPPILAYLRDPRPNQSVADWTQTKGHEDEVMRAAIQLLTRQFAVVCIAN